ncbi:MAG: TetR/AcrR family transcriptional regulator [Kangiellaceae bacterium]|nr:TetR/AcrR family transcriptional regulator [Kangiellaceae bacterium]
MGRTGHCRQHILDAGLSVLSLKGYNGTGVKDIVDAAGVPKGSFYNHFDSKQAFVIEAIEKVAKQSTFESKTVLENPEYSPKQRLLNWFDIASDEMKSESFCGGCLVGNICLEMADENPEIRHTVNQIMEQYIQLIADCLADAKNQGELPKSTDTNALAEFIHCAWEGTVMRMKACRKCNPYTNFRNQIENFFS